MSLRAQRVVGAAIGFMAVVAVTACSLAALDGLAGNANENVGPDAVADGQADGVAITEGGADEGGACAANVDSDPLNCGRCGHDCLGGACNAGACQPVVLASSLPEVFFIALDATNVYWSGATDVVGRVPKAGGNPTPFASGLTMPSAIAADSAALYVGVGGPDGGIEARPLGGGASSRIAPGAAVQRMVARGDSLYWTDQSTPGGSVKKVGRVAPFTVTSLGDSQGDPRGVAVSSTTVFWTDATSGGIFSCPMAGCAGAPPTALATGQNYPIAIAVDDTAVYFAENTPPYRIRSCPAAGCVGAPTDLAVSPAVTAMVATSTALYWVTSNAATGTVSTCPLSGTKGAAPVVLAGNQNRPYAIAVDDRAIYWATRGTESLSDATIVKLAR